MAVDRGETSHTAELENEDELDEDEDAWALQESSSGPLGDVAVGAMSDDGAGDTDATTAQGYDSYDFLPPLQRLEKYALTLLYKRDRNMVGRLFLETLKSVADNPHDVATVMWILYNMSENEDPSIRTELMDHIPHIAMLCHSEKEKLLYVVDHLLPFVAKQLTDNDAQVRKAAQVTLLVLMDQSLVGQSAVEEIVCPVVNVLSETDQYPVNAVQLMSKMAPFLGRVATEQLFLARFCDLCRNSDMQVRKMCAAYFGEFCAVVGQPTTEENLLCRFVDLCQDDVPGVRKACAEVIMSVSCACTLQRRKTVLAPMFVSLLWDPVRWVRSSAFKTLGPFISTFAVPSVADLVYNENGELVLVNREGCEFRLNPNIDRGDTDMEDDLGCDTRKDKTLPRAHKSRPPTRIEDIKNFDRKGEQNLLQSENGNKTSEEKHLGLDNANENNLGKTGQVNEENNGIKPSVESTNQEIVNNNNNPEIDKENLVESIANSSKQVTTDSTLGPFVACINNFKIKNNSSDSMEAASESSSDCVTQETDLDDFCHSQGDNTIENSLDQDMSSTSSTPVTTPEENDFNSFYFWRVPIPDISDQDEAVEDGVLDYLTGLVNASNATVAYREDDNSDLFSSKTSEAGHRQDIVPQELVELFVSMTNPPHAHMTDIEIALHCAFSLPAVALTLGRENWGFLRGTYERLAADMQWKVRKTVACSVHELAEILGEELTAKDLVPIYTGFIKDLDEVRIGALKHLADFVKLLPSCKRKSFLSQFEMFLVTDNEWNWRFREELAQQLLRIIPLYTPEETCVHLVPVAIALLRDKVAAVRTTALLLVTCLINHVTSEGPLLRKLLPLLAQEFANSTRWERRQAFALLCSHLVAGRVLGGDQFAREVLPYLLDLSYDKVPNVRLAVARTLASDIMAHQFFSSDQSPHQEVLMQVLKRLINDKDRDVRFFADPRRGAPSQIQQQLSSGASHVQLPTC
ncbi:serine/threonine-protein phosphatase 4 regulatory subunit 1-like isoform X2 [Thrips palmi]|uniref:Serine/threonine-protein phosphatase 4 regulatory subunit 1-like isoform X2 n=1 Tax=Thrips palmi TaxID=161013 RepID=A0A6P8ZHY2_THRPL|nr:serine/threonine-protein phosphatase 4 regulatory subunit 1-like isoform X2 [Thrips palmi]